MRRKAEFRPEAFADVAEAFSYYQEQQYDLGGEFETELDQALEVLSEMAEMGPVVYRDLHRVLLQRFPFAVYYLITASAIEVRGVIHTSRSPHVWRSRA